MKTLDVARSDIISNKQNKRGRMNSRTMVIQVTLGGRYRCKNCYCKNRGAVKYGKEDKRSYWMISPGLEDLKEIVEMRMSNGRCAKH